MKGYSAMEIVLVYLLCVSPLLLNRHVVTGAQALLGCLESRSSSFGKVEFENQEKSALRLFPLSSTVCYT
jgi:hypothetical protein